jgi:hypothetical protein
MNADNKYTYKTCEREYCGKTFKTHHHGQRFCSKRCQEAERVSRLPKKEPRDIEYERAAWEIVEDKDPDERCRFVPGSRLTSDLDMKQLLYEKIIASGSIIKNRKTDEKFKVDYTNHGAFAYVIAKCLIRIE